MSDKNLAQHFHKYFSLCIADTIDLKSVVFKLRYDVYCTELGYEKDCPANCEKDKFDEYANHILVRHNESGDYAGCVRLVSPPPHNPKALLPFEANCPHSFDPEKVAFLRTGDYVNVGEVSRLAVASAFRRRRSDAKSPEGINPECGPQEIGKEMRYFPLIAVALYFAATCVAIDKKLKYAVVMMEPALARLLNRSGINFIQLGDSIDYHGQRALFYTDGAFIDLLKPELKEFYKSVEKQIACDIN